MGVNKNPSYSAKDTLSVKRENEIFLSYSEHDNTRMVSRLKRYLEEKANED